MKDFIPYATQWIDEDDIQAVAEVLRSGWVTQGPVVGKFEEALALYCGAKYAVAVSSGTAALHLAALAAGISTGDRVVTSPITFVASSNCVLYTGGETRFADIDPDTHNLSVSELEKLLSKETIKAVIPVHFAGLPCDMEKIGALAKDRGLKVIEDASHALGARYRASDGQWIKVGSCRHSDMTTFSFHPVKHITTGEGGAITTNDKELFDKLRRLRSHGIVREGVIDEAILEKKPWYYEMRELGYNYRITDIQCALGISQLKRIDGWLARRAEIAARYDSAFADFDAITTRPNQDGVESAHHLYVIEIDQRNEVFLSLRQSGIGTQIHYIPVHFQPYYRERFGYRAGDFPAAEAYYRRCLSIPIYPKMTDENVDQVIAAVREVAGKRSGVRSP